MGVFKREGSPYWYYSFKIAGHPQQKGSTGYEDKKLALAKYLKIRNESQQQTDFKKPSKITVRELLEWANRSYWKYNRLESAVGAVLSQFGACVASIISLQSILDYREKRLEKVAPSSINRELTYLKAAYNYAIKCGTLFANPLKDLEAFSERDRKRDKFLKPDEKRVLLSAAPTKLRDVILFALKTGMRQGEILGLKWADIDTMRAQMKVISYKGKEVIVRYVPIFGQTQEVIDRQPKGSEYVFTDSKGQKMGRNSCVHSTYAKLVKRLKIQDGDFHFHDLRHTFASDYLMMGGTLSALQDILGHRKSDTTRRYAHLSKEHLKVEMDRLPYEKFDCAPVQKLSNIYPNGGTMVNQESPM